MVVRPSVTLRGHSGRIRAITEVGDKGTLVTASADKKVRVWSPSESRCIRTISGFDAEVIDIDTVDDRTVVVVFENYVQVLGITGEVVAKSRPFPNEFRCVAALSGTTALVGDTVGNLTKISWCDGSVHTVSHFMKVFSKGVSSISVCETQEYGRTLALGSTDKNAQLWSLDDMARIRMYQGHENPVLCATHNEQYFVTCSRMRDTMIRVYHLGNRTCLAEFGERDSLVRFVRFIPKTNILVSAGQRSIMLHEIPSGELIKKFDLNIRTSGYALLKSMKVAVGDMDTFAVHLYEIPNLRQCLAPAPISVDRFVDHAQERAIVPSGFVGSSAASSSSSPRVQNVSALSTSGHTGLRNSFNLPSEPSVTGSTTAPTDLIDVDSLPVNEGHRENAVRHQFKAYSLAKGKSELTIADATDALNTMLGILGVDGKVSEDEFEATFVRVSEELKVDENAFVAVFRSIMAVGGTVDDEDYLEQFYMEMFNTMNFGRTLVGVEYATRILRHAYKELKQKGHVDERRFVLADITPEMMANFIGGFDRKVSCGDFVAAARSIAHGIQYRGFN